MWTTIGHAAAKANLQKAYNANRLPHAYLITGTPYVGRRTLALDIAKLANCGGAATADGPCGECKSCLRVDRRANADVALIEVVKDEKTGAARKNISIEQVQDLRRAANLKPSESRYRVFIIDAAEKMSNEASNALLKMLEEPPALVKIILIAASADDLLSTIVSRCVALQLNALGAAEVRGALDAAAGASGLDESRKARIVELAAGRVGWALRAAADESFLDAFEQANLRCRTLYESELPERFRMVEEMALQFRKNRQEVLDELNYWMLWWHQRARALVNAPAGAADAGDAHANGSAPALADALASWEAVGEARAMLSGNVNPRLTLETMALEIPPPRG